MNDEIIETIQSEGMINIAHRWVEIQIELDVKRETEKAYFGNVSVYEVVDGRHEILFEEEDTWIPKSMSDNPWWICTVKFEHSGKVSNRVFEVNDY